MMALPLASSLRAKLFAVATIALSGVFIVLMFRSLKLVADAWFVGCVFHSDGTKTCQWDIQWVPDPCTSPPTPASPPNRLGAPSAPLMHAFYMSLAFGVFTPLGSVSFTMFREMLRLSPAQAKAAHGLFMTVAVILSVLGFLQIYYAHGGSCGAAGGPHFQSMHSWLGLLVLALYWLQGPTALLFLSNTRLLKAGGFWRSELRRYHLFVGGVAIFGGLLSIVSGILDASGKLPAGGLAAPVPAFWWPMAIAGAVCMALSLVLALTLYEGRVPVSVRRVTVADPMMPVINTPLMAEHEAEQQQGGGGGDSERAVLTEVFSLAEVAKHASEHDCWLVIHGIVYDVTAFLHTHPGGRSLLLRYRGAVADAGFDSSHEISVLTSSLPLLTLKGRLEDAPPSAVLSTPPPEAAAADAAAAAADAADAPPFLTRRPQLVVLGDVASLSHDVLRLRLMLPPDARTLGLPVGQHLKLFAPATRLRAPQAQGQWNGRDDPEAGSAQIERKYTPTTSADDRGYFELLVKVYAAAQLDPFPDGGKMSQYLASLSVGDTLELSGPWGSNEYLGQGRFRSAGEVTGCSRLGMMAGGTGLTPMLQVITAVLKEPREASPVISLLLANQTEADILARDMLEGLQAQHPERFHLWYTLDRPPEGWGYSSGFISAEMIAEHLPPPGDQTLVLLCGPPPMVKFACQENLNALGYPADRQICF